MGIYIQRMYTRMFIEAPFIRVKTGNNPNMSINSIMGNTRKLFYILMMENFNKLKVHKHGSISQTC